MYSWGDDTKEWKNPGAFKYDDAKKGYLEKLAAEATEKGPRTYLTKKQPNMKIVDPLGKDISTDSKNPVIVAVDGTGSMQQWPAGIFDRLPLLYQTLSQWRDDVELSFAVIGDANGPDKWPVQMTPFGKGVVLDDYLKALHAEGKGGPGIRESYELWAYFVKEHVRTPNAKAPFLFVMGDEMFYNQVNPEQVQQHFGGGLQEPVSSVDVWKSLAEHYDIRFLRKSYDGHDARIRDQWGSAIGVDHIVDVPTPQDMNDLRIVDIAMGIVAKDWGKFSQYQKSLAARQDGKSIKTVMDSLRAASVAGTMKSTYAGKEGPKSESLTEV